MCYITAHNRQKSTYIDNSRIDGGREIPNNVTTAALKSLGAILNFIVFFA